MIDSKIVQSKRLGKLNQTAKKQLEILSNDKNIIGSNKLDNNNTNKSLE